MPPQPTSMSSGCAPIARTAALLAALRRALSAASSSIFSNGVVEAAVPGEDQRRDVRLRCLDLHYQLEPAHSRQLDVGDDQVPVLLAGCGERRFGGRRPPHEGTLTHHLGRHCSKNRIVLYKQNA
jgi:hypothetical protein